MMTNWFLWSPQNYHVDLLVWQQPLMDHLSVRGSGSEQAPTSPNTHRHMRVISFQSWQSCRDFCFIILTLQVKKLGFREVKKPSQGRAGTRTKCSTSQIQPLSTAPWRPEKNLEWPGMQRAKGLKLQIKFFEPQNMGYRYLPNIQPLEGSCV